MSDVSAGILIFVVVIVLCLGVAWIAQGSDFFLYKVFAPKYANVQREVFENTHSYNKGMVQELQNMQFEYEQASPEHKAALASIILHRVADYDETKLPPDMQNFVRKLRDTK